MGDIHVYQLVQTWMPRALLHHQASLCAMTGAMSAVNRCTATSKGLGRERRRGAVERLKPARTDGPSDTVWVRVPHRGRMEMPGMVGERRPGEARQTDYITPFAINARATCFRYDGRVAPQQILRDGEVPYKSSSCTRSPSYTVQPRSGVAHAGGHLCRSGVAGLSRAPGSRSGVLVGRAASGVASFSPSGASRARGTETRLYLHGTQRAYWRHCGYADVSCANAGPTAGCWGRVLAALRRWWLWIGCGWSSPPSTF